MKRLAKWGAVILVGLLVAAFAIVPDKVARDMNRVTNPPHAVSADAAKLHPTLRIADLHADPLLWGRDLSKRSDIGQVDVPRLIDGNVALQVFSVVTKTPRHMNIHSNDDSTDNILPLAILQLWPPSTYRSLFARAMYQAERLAEFAKRSDGKLVLVRTRAELADFLAARAKDPQRVAGILALEGAQALEGDLKHVDDLYNAGFRMMAPSHFYDTDFGGSSAGVKKGGLTALGRAWVARMNERHLIVDLAHASAETIDDVLAAKPVALVVSHTGVRASCDNQRNLTDDQVRRIAAAGGLIGVGYWSIATCGTDARSVARAIAAAIRIAGSDHVSLGSDFDGAVGAPFDVAHLSELTEALLDQRVSEADIRKVMGENELTFLATHLPER